MAQATVNIGDYQITLEAYLKWKDEGIGWNEAWGIWDYNQEWVLRLEDFEILEIEGPDGQLIGINETEWHLSDLRERIWDRSDEIEDQPVS